MPPPNVIWVCWSNFCVHIGLSKILAKKMIRFYGLFVNKCDSKFKSVQNKKLFSVFRKGFNFVQLTVQINVQRLDNAGKDNCI